MMTFQDVRSLVAQSHANGPSFQECRAALDQQAYEELGPGSLTAGEAAQIFRLRRGTAMRSKKDVIGLDDLLNALEGRSASDRVLLFHFSGPEKVFSIFVDDASRELIACVRVR